jgi:hypothetical protein
VPIPSCPTCDLLSEQVVATTTRYIKLGSRLEIAQLERDTERISELAFSGIRPLSRVFRLTAGYQSPR